VVLRSCLIFTVLNKISTTQTIYELKNKSYFIITLLWTYLPTLTLSRYMHLQSMINKCNIHIMLYAMSFQSENPTVLVSATVSAVRTCQICRTDRLTVGCSE